MHIETPNQMKDLDTTSKPMSPKLMLIGATTFLWIFFFLLAIEGYVRFVADDGMQFDLEMWKYARCVKQVSNNPLIGHEHAPNRRAILMGAEFRTNSHGLRDRDFSYERVPGRLRILMLGDSLTVGWGVPVEETFSKRIEAMYMANGIDAEVVNTGVGNYNTIQEVASFLTEGFKYQPDIVVLNFFVNDAEPVPVAKSSIITRWCASCVFIAGRIDSLIRMLTLQTSWDKYYLSLYGDGSAKGWLDAKDSIQKLAEFCRAKRIKLLIASLPELHDVHNYRFQRITDLVREAAQQNGVPFVDVLPFLQVEQSANLWVTPPDPHPNARAHELIADGLFGALQKLPK